MDQKEKPKKKKDLKKSFDEWKERPAKKKVQEKSTKVKYPKSWLQEEEED